MNRRQKILIALESYPPDINGSGIATQRLARGLVARGYAIGVVCPGKKRTMESSIEHGVLVFRIGSMPTLFHKDYRFAPFARKFMGHVFLEFKPDILHVADCFATAEAALSRARKSGIPIVGTNHFHPDNLLHYLKLSKGNTGYKALKKALWVYFRRVYNYASVITVPTQTAADIVERVGVTPPIRVISNGLDFALFKRRQVSEAVFARYGIDPAIPRVLTVGRVEKEKRVDVLIEAFSRMEKGSAQLIIVGKGKEEARLKKIARERGISRLSVFVGPMPNNELYQFYCISDVYATASEVELQGLSIMEAMAYGLPIAAARSMAIPELVRDEVNGLLFAPGNSADAAEKIARLIADPALRRIMASESLRLIQAHDFAKTLDAFEEAYAFAMSQK